MTNKTFASIDLAPVRIGLALAILTILLNIGLGSAFGLFEEPIRAYIREGIAANPTLFKDAAREGDFIWRWIQRAHFHAGGIGAYVLGLIILTAISSMSAMQKRVTSILLGLSICYPLAWLMMYVYAPWVGRPVAHHLPIVEALTDIGVGSLCLGLVSLLWGLFLRRDPATTAA